MPLKKLLASHDASVGQWYDMTKSHVALHFDHLGLRNTILPLMMLSASHNADINVVASHDTNTNANGITSCDTETNANGIFDATDIK